MSGLRERLGSTPHIQGYLVDQVGLLGRYRLPLPIRTELSATPGQVFHDQSRRLGQQESSAVKGAGSHGVVEIH